jgi:MFS superfamily sulfate permease-like transporter
MPADVPDPVSVKRPTAGRHALFPPAQWLADYQRAYLRRDAIAGVSLAAYVIPESMAYATLAGLPPQYGVYCYLMAGPVYALLGSSRQLAIGPLPRFLS